VEPARPLVVEDNVVGGSPAERQPLARHEGNDRVAGNRIANDEMSVSFWHFAIFPA
jgi:hypothetical protein